jgi:hypothetical protein
MEQNQHMENQRTNNIPQTWRGEINSHKANPLNKKPPPELQLKTTPPANVVVGEKRLHPHTGKPPQKPP